MILRSWKMWNSWQWLVHIKKSNYRPLNYRTLILNIICTYIHCMGNIYIKLNLPCHAWWFIIIGVIFIIRILTAKYSNVNHKLLWVLRFEYLCSGVLKAGSPGSNYAFLTDLRLLKNVKNHISNNNILLIKII